MKTLRRGNSRYSSLTESVPGEERYQHVGTEHLVAIGDASASLGLISTLVLSICISSIMELPVAYHEFLELFLSSSSAFSTYTTTYSLLEYYYVQTLKGVDTFMASRVNVDVGPGADGIDDDSVLMSSRDSDGGVEHILEDRAKLVQELEVAFASFNDMRMWARNSMWCSLICLLGAGITKIDPLSDPLTGTIPEVSSSGKVAVFFALALACLASAWLAGFQSRDVRAYLVISFVGCLLAGLESYLVRPRFRTGKLMASSFLMASIILVPFTVRSFRGTYLKMAKRYARIF